MEWCEENGIGFIFALPGNNTLDRPVETAADDIRTRRALDQKPALRGFAETRYQAKSWTKQRRACARIEATTRGLDIRSLPPRRRGSPASTPARPSTSTRRSTAPAARPRTPLRRGTLIKLHKTQLASDRTSDPFV